LLYRWKQQQEQAKGDSLLTVEEKAELLALRKEVKRLRMEKEILKKASVSVRYKTEHTVN
jgi:transposase